MKIKVSKNTVIFSITIFAISAFLRFWQLSERFSWGGVEGSFIWDIWYVATGHLTLIGFESAAIGGFNFPPFLLYFLVPFYWFFQGNPIYIGIILAVLGSLTSVLFFLIGKNILNTNVGLTAAFIHTFSLQAITIDHEFIGGTFVVSVSLLVIFLLWRVLEQQKFKTRNLVILGSIIGLSFSAHYQAIFLLVGVLIVFSIYRKLEIKNTLIFLTSTFIWLSPLLLFDLRHNFYHVKGIVALLTGYTSSSQTAGFIVSGQYLLQNFFGLFWQQSYFFKFGKLGILTILGITISISLIFYFLIWKEKTLLKFKPLILYFFSLFVLGLGVLSFYRSGDYQFDYYYWYLVPVTIFLAVIGLDVLWKKRFFLIMVALVALFLVVNLNDFTKFFQTEPYNIVEKTAKTVLLDAKNKNLPEINVKFHGVEAGSYDYYFYWYAKKIGVNVDSLTLISNREEFQERSILGSGRPPIKLLSRTTGENLAPNYSVTKTGVQIL